MNDLCLGIDTSNYRTSVAIVGRYKVIYDGRILLEVKEGERGLRQQEALFQHINNLPILIEEAMKEIQSPDSIKAIAASNRPRNVEGSYMPCFNAGVTVAKILGSTLGIKPSFHSHQEGHIKAATVWTKFEKEITYGAFHFSGGTTESLLLKDGNITLVGGTKDISFGQVLDRIGVSLGMKFPSGEELDKLAFEGDAGNYTMPALKINDGYINLSGLESHCQRLIESGTLPKDNKEEISNFAKDVFICIKDGIELMIEHMKDEYGIKKFLLAGGVSSSETLKALLKREDVFFAHPSLSGDNAVGIACLGGEEIWQ